MLFIIICSESNFQGKHKRIIIDRIQLELVEAETLQELRKRATIIYNAWCEANHKYFPHTWHYLRGEF